MHSFEVHSNESACRKSERLGLDQDKLHSVFKSKSDSFHNSNNGLFSVNYTRMDGYFSVMQRYMRRRKAFIATV